MNVRCVIVALSNPFPRAGCLSLLFLIIASCDAPQRPDSPKELTAIPSVLNLEYFRVGGKRDGQVILQNATEREIAIARVTSSCPCVNVRVGRMPLAIRRDGRAVLELNFDHGQEPDFRGVLLVNVEGFDQSSRRVLHFRVRASVE